MSITTETRIMDHSLAHHHPHLDNWAVSSRLMDFTPRDRKSPIPQYPRFQAPVSPMHPFEPTLKQEPFRPTPTIETQRRTSEPAARKDGPISEDKEHFDTSAGKAGWKLSMYQSPKSGKVSTGKEKDRKPLDPPPFVQLNANYQVDPTGSFMSSPYFFMKSELVEPDLNPDTPPKVIHNGLSGTQVSSLYKLKDAYGHSGAFFTFGDMAVTKQGKFRLKFTLYERPFNPVDHSYLPEYVERSSIYSSVFTAFPARTYPGLEQSTPKTQGFAEQGVRLRIRKESLAAGTRKRNLSAVVTESPTEARRGEAVRRRIAYTSAQLGGPSTLALASPTQLVPTQAFPTPPQHHHTPHHHSQHHHSSPTSAGSGHDTSSASYVWNDMQGINSFTWNGNPMASAPSWQSHHHHSAHSSQGSSAH